MITTDRNRVTIRGGFSPKELPKLIAAMHAIENNLGYKDISLDFSSCDAAFQAAMLGLVARCQYYWKKGIDVSLIVPSERKLRSLFHNANWAHLIDIQGHSESTFQGTSHVPATKFTNGKEQHAAVNRILDSMLKSVTEYTRSDLRAIEWAINEITDNVINHSTSPVGGFVQVTNFSKAKRIDFSVADAGLGIPKTLQATHADIKSDTVALDRAIREGVTRDKSIGQGNGLYGTWRITELGGGTLDIVSGFGSLSSSRNGLHIQQQQVPFNGTLINGSIKYAQPVNLSEALQFKGRQFAPIDHLELQYETDSDGFVYFNLKAESEGFGSRSAGEPIRKKIFNLIRLTSNSCVRVDFENVPLVSSSFADEVFGKLFIELGPLQFSQFIKFENIDPLVRNLVDKAIMQRMRDTT
jgi:anti-sigma regulatory factor (Ser/Thr protein kinase)